MKPVFYLLLIALAVSSPGLADDVVWPLKIPISQSSSFAEFRGMRFHAGIDLRTQQKNGFPVVAIADGFISRASVQFRGYGYALYIDHPELKTRVVYGHLQDFSGPIREYIDQKLKKLGRRHGINDFFSADRFPVKKGQVVALSGDTGMGPSHLHFEMRTMADEPLAPSIFGYRPEDNISPTFHWYYVEPMAHAAVVDGSFLPARYNLKNSGNGRYRLTDVPMVHGKVAMQAGISDTNGAGNRYGVEKVTLTADGRKLLERTFHKYSYDDNNQCPWVYDYFKSNQKNTGYVVNLFKWPFDTLPMAEGYEAWSGCVDSAGFAQGSMNFVVEAVDFGNNNIRAEGTLKSQQMDFSRSIPAEELKDHVFSEIHPGDFSLIAIGRRSGGGNSGAPVFGKVLCRDRSGETAEVETILAGGRVEIAFKYDARWQGGAWLGEKQLLPETVFIDSKGGEVNLEPGARATFPQGSLNFPVFAALRKTDLAPSPGGNAKRGWLKPYSSVWKLTPDNVVFASEARIRISPDDYRGNLRKLGIYSVNGAGSYSHNGEKVEDGALVFSARTGGSYVILEDLLPPVLSYARQTTDYHLGRCYVFKVSDIGKGVDYLSAAAQINGAGVEVYSDPDKAEIYVVKPQKPLPHLISLQIDDQAANTALINKTIKK